MQVAILSPDLRSALRALDRASGETKAGIRRGLFRIGAVIKREAVRYAPISPSATIMRRIAKAAGRPRKKGSMKATPGGLMRSIAFASDTEKAEIFVPSNSAAGKYARRIHDEKGLSWWKRGPGTQAKGAHADEKYILRAIQDNEAKAIQIAEDQLAKVTA